MKVACAPEDLTPLPSGHIRIVTARLDPSRQVEKEKVSGIVY
jgi:hypothetical protein